MRMLLLAALLTLTAQPASMDFGERLARFQQHYNRFFREYAGCPRAAVDISECDPRKGIFNRAEFDKAAQEARFLFPL